MGLETGTYVTDLNAAWPLGSDPEAQGDDHLRLVKSVLRNTFPNASGPLNYTSTVSKTASYTAVMSDDKTTFLCDATGGPITITIPAPATIGPRWSCRVMKVDSTPNIVSIIAANAGAINNLSQINLGSQFTEYEVFSSGTALFAVNLSGGTTGSGTGAVTLTHPFGRLSLVSGSPVMSSDATSNIIYWVPYGGSSYPWFDGASWHIRSANQLSLTLDGASGHTGYHAPSTNFDLFLTNYTGSDLLVSGPAWSTDLARAASGGLVLQNGILVNASSINAKYGTTNATLGIPAYEATFVGTFRTITTAAYTAMLMNPAGANGGNQGQLFLWNAYNRRLTRAASIDSGASYTYQSATPRIARSSAYNSVGFVSGQAEDAVAATFSYQFGLTAANHYATQLLYLDGVALPARGQSQNGPYASNTAWANLLTALVEKQLGFHQVQAYEQADGTNATTFNQAANNTVSVNHWC